MIKVIYEGLPDNGKSLITAWQTYLLLHRNAGWWENKITKTPRPVATEMQLSPWVEKEFGVWPDGFIRYYKWRELANIRQADIIIDDMGTRLSAQKWQETPGSTRNFFRLMGHYEVDIYANAQNFLDIDNAVRRLARNVISVSKYMGSERPGDSYPPVKRIWGVILRRQVHYTELDKEIWQRKESSMIWPMFITKKKCSIYNTLQILDPANLPPYECFERACTNSNHKDAYGRPFLHFYHAK